MAIPIQLRRGTAAEWTSANPVLAEGEFGLETDTRKFKFGNGASAWSSLSYAADVSLYATLANAALTGVPTAPTAAGTTNTTQIATTAMVQAAIALAVTGVLELKGNIDASTNPNYPAGSTGDLYYATVAGKVGGASGKSVDIGDAVVCKADNAGGTEASVGTSWFVLEHNLAGALLAANNLSDITDASAARTNLGLAHALKDDTTAAVTVGYTVTPYNAGTKTTGTFTPAPANGNYQYLTNGGAFTIAAPAADCGISLHVTNNGSAGAITMSGFTVGSNVGDDLDTVDTNKFRIRIERINGVSTYSVQALQ
jgi:hypothetical protein